jgi:hypothetical protein
MPAFIQHVVEAVHCLYVFHHVLALELLHMHVDDIVDFNEGQAMLAIDD